jgi:hypothetical protein
MKGELNYSSDPRPRIVITWDKETKNFGYIWPNGKLRFNTTIRQASQQSSIPPKELLQRLEAGETFSFDSDIPLIEE